MVVGLPAANCEEVGFQMRRCLEIVGNETPEDVANFQKIADICSSTRLLHAYTTFSMSFRYTEIVRRYCMNNVFHFGYGLVQRVYLL